MKNKKRLQEPRPTLMTLAPPHVALDHCHQSSTANTPRALTMIGEASTKCLPRGKLRANSWPRQDGYNFYNLLSRSRRTAIMLSLPENRDVYYLFSFFTTEKIFRERGERKIPRGACWSWSGEIVTVYCAPPWCSQGALFASRNAL